MKLKPDITPYSKFRDQIAYHNLQQMYEIKRCEAQRTDVCLYGVHSTALSLASTPPIN